MYTTSEHPSTHLWPSYEVCTARATFVGPLWASEGLAVTQMSRTRRSGHDPSCSLASTRVPRRNGSPYNIGCPPLPHVAPKCPTSCNLPAEQSARNRGSLSHKLLGTGLTSQIYKITIGVSSWCQKQAAPICQGKVAPGLLLSTQLHSRFASVSGGQSRLLGSPRSRTRVRDVHALGSCLYVWLNP